MIGNIHVSQEVLWSVAGTIASAAVGAVATLYVSVGSLDDRQSVSETKIVTLQNSTTRSETDLRHIRDRVDRIYELLADPTVPRKEPEDEDL